MMGFTDILALWLTTLGLAVDKGQGFSKGFVSYEM
jgi:hypothetical protein